MAGAAEDGGRESPARDGPRAARRSLAPAQEDEPGVCDRAPPGGRRSATPLAAVVAQVARPRLLVTSRRKPQCQCRLKFCFDFTFRCRASGGGLGHLIWENIRVGETIITLY